MYIMAILYYISDADHNFYSFPTKDCRQRGIVLGVLKQKISLKSSCWNNVLGLYLIVMKSCMRDENKCMIKKGYLPVCRGIGLMRFLPSSSIHQKHYN